MRCRSVGDIDSPGDGTGEGGAVHRIWVAILVHTNCEHRVAERLAELSVECYVPVQEEVHRWSDRIKRVQRVVIPSVVFAKVGLSRINDLKRLSFVRGLLTNPGESKPAVIPDVQIERLRFMLGQTDVPVELGCDVRQFSVGCSVRVVRGLFRGLEGTVLYADEGVHVGVLLEGLGYAHMEINESDIEEI